MLTPYGQREWTLILVMGLAAAAALIYFEHWAPAIIVLVAMLAALSFFRDPRRTVPAHKSIVVSPADGRISSIHELGHYEPLGEPALCIRIFLSVLNVHVNRAPCHGVVLQLKPTPGLYISALNPKSAECNEANLIVLGHPVKRTPLCAVRQVAGAIARTIVCGIKEGDIVQRGQRFGMIKFGSTTELYLPLSARPEVQVRQGQRVVGGVTVLARVNPVAASDYDAQEADATEAGTNA